MRMTYNVLFNNDEGHRVECVGPVLGSLEQVEAFAHSYAKERLIYVDEILPCTNTIILPHSQTIRYMEIECGEVEWHTVVADIAVQAKSDPEGLVGAVANYVNGMSDEDAIGLCYFMDTLPVEDKPELDLDLEENFSEILRQHALVVLAHLVAKQY